jgi:predicted NBD/HSP70 family sugar kinase
MQTEKSPRIRTATPSSVREVNRWIVLELVRRHEPISRAEVARLTGIVRSSVSDITDQLITENLLVEERGETRRGRIPMRLRLNDEYVRVLGLSVRPDCCQLAGAGLRGRMQHVLQFPTPRDPQRFVREFVEAMDHLEFQVDTGLHGGYKRLGVAISGHVDARTGRISWIPALPELTDFDIAQAINRETGMQVVVDNDCNAGALSELWLNVEEMSATDFVFVEVGDVGAGAGIMMNGEPYRGYDSRVAAEFGHMIVDPAGPPCTCGRRGCWERYISNSATWERFRPGTPFSAEAFQELIQLAENGDESALAAIRETGRYLALGISNIAFALNPAQIVVAGRLTAVWNTIGSQLERNFVCPHTNCVVRPARLAGEDSLLHGAICVALRDVFAKPRFG